jgi:hypothetical protein
MKDVMNKAIDHPLATWFVVGVLVDGAVRIIKAVKS